MLRRLIPLVVLLGLLPAAPAAVADPSYQALGCYTDPAGDAVAERADLVEVCVRYFEAEGDNPSAVLVVVDAVGPLNPLTDDAWTNAGTALTAGFSIDGDEEVDRQLQVTREGDDVRGVVLDADGDELPGCDVLTAPGAGGVLRAQLPGACLDDAPGVRTSVALAYEATAGTAVGVDRVPDGALPAPLPPGDQAPLCANATVEPGASLTIRRVACDIGGTEPITQAVATSQFVFDDPATATIDPYQADWAVIARDDDFADALAGSSLSFGQGPLLFTHSPTSAPEGHDPATLAGATAVELRRVLPRGRTVYLMGGSAALDPGLDQHIRDLGYEVQRFAGASREGTAALVSAEVARRVDEFVAQSDFPDTNMVLIATRSNWPDAVVAGSVGAFWGMPILLADVEPPVHPETLAALDALRPDYIHVIGGSGVISDAAGRAIGDHARANGYGQGRPGEDLTTGRWSSFCRGSFVCRWGGTNRIQTGGIVSQLNRAMVERFGDLTTLVPDNPQQYAAAVSLASGGANYAYALAASTVSGRFGGAVFIPTEGQSLHPDVVNELCNRTGAEGYVELVEQLVLVADRDVLSDEFAAEVRNLVEGGCPAP